MKRPIILLLIIQLIFLHNTSPCYAQKSFPLGLRGFTSPDGRLYNVLTYKYSKGVLTVNFTRSANSAKKYLKMGHGSWLDRPMKANEPTQLKQKVSQADASKIIEALDDSESFWIFYCYNTGKGYLNVTKSERYRRKVNFDTYP